MTSDQIERTRCSWSNRHQANARSLEIIKAKKKYRNDLKKLADEFDRIEADDASQKIHNAMKKLKNCFGSFPKLHDKCLKEIVDDCLHDHENNAKQIISVLSVRVKC